MYAHGIFEHVVETDTADERDRKDCSPTKEDEEQQET